MGCKLGQINSKELETKVDGLYKTAEEFKQIVFKLNKEAADLKHFRKPMFKSANNLPSIYVDFSKYIPGRVYG